MVWLALIWTPVYAAGHQLAIGCLHPMLLRENSGVGAERGRRMGELAHLVPGAACVEDSGVEQQCVAWELGAADRADSRQRQVTELMASGGLI